MVSAASAVERSLDAVSIGGDLEHRIAEIQAVENPAKRAGLMAVHSAVARFPDVFANHFGLDYHPPGLTHLDYGVQSDVYRLDATHVLKVIKHGGDEDEQAQTADQLSHEHSEMARHIGPAVLPHTIFVDRHPIARSQSAVQIIQPYRELDFLQLSDDFESTQPLRDRLLAAWQANPNFLDEMTAIVRGGRTLSQAHDHLIIDVVGRNNVGIARENSRVEIVDGQPVPLERPDDHALASWHLDRLEATVESLAA